MGQCELFFDLTSHTRRDSTDKSPSAPPSGGRFAGSCPVSLSDAGPASLSQRGKPTEVRPVQRGAILFPLFLTRFKKRGRPPGRVPAIANPSKMSLPFDKPV